MEENRVTSLVVISRYTTIDFLQFSHFLYNVIYMWAGGGFLRPTPLDEIPHSIRHRYSICWSFWPLACQDSLTCINIVIVRKDRGACVNLMHLIVHMSAFPEHPRKSLEGLPQRICRRKQICHFLSSAGTLDQCQGAPEPSILGCPFGQLHRTQTYPQSWQIRSQQFLLSGRC